MNRIKTIIKEPLLHFATVGVAVFLLFEAVAPEDAAFGQRDILVDRDTLLTHIQYRTRTFEPELAARRLAAMSPDELENIVRGYVREEALHREALSMGMESNDYIIKRRLIQKVEFLAQGLADASVAISDDELIAYYQAYRDDYLVDAQATFTHVFFSAEQRGYQQARLDAEQQLQQLRANRVVFADAVQFGDRFAFHRNYVERTPELVASHLGDEIANAIFAESAPKDKWIGPFDSEHGSHLVLVSRTQPQRYPALDEIRQRVLNDATSERLREHREASIDAIVADYRVHLTYEAGRVSEGIVQ